MRPETFKIMVTLALFIGALFLGLSLINDATRLFGD